MRRAVLLIAMLAAAPTAAAAPHFVALPSPLTPLSSSPPLGDTHGSGEGIPHRVRATTRVTVSIGPTGTPIAIRVGQRLDVTKVGDYAFTIGAPVVDVAAGSGSQSAPGRRDGAILWAGFNPGRRALIADAGLRLTAAASLPLRVELHGGRLTLRNVTAVEASAFAADAQRAELLATLASFRRTSAGGAPATGGGAVLTSKATAVRLVVTAPLEITGTVGRRRVALILGGATHPLSATFPAGRVRLAVRPLPAPELLRPPTGEPGRALLARAVRASLELARARQYDTFLGNPDPAGASRTTYVYVSSHRAPAPTAIASAPAGHRRLRSVLIAVLALAAAAVAAVAWSRS